MNKYTPLLLLAGLPISAPGLPVFSDAFTGPAIDAGYATTVTAGDGGAALAGASFLELTNDATGATNANGRVSIATAFSGFATPFTATLDANPGLVTWETNLRYNRTADPSGFAGGNYGLAFILAGTSADFTAGSGYAVLYGGAAAPEPLRFVRYTNGLTTGGTITDLIAGPTLAAVNDYASVRVTYDPTTSGWSLFVRDDGAAAWAAPTTLTGTHQVGAPALDATHTTAATTLTHAGYLWNYSTAASQTAQFDNLRVTVTPAAIPEPATTGAILGAAAAFMMRRRKVTPSKCVRRS